MTRQEQHEAVLGWEDLVITASPARLDQLLATVDSHLPPDWVRNRQAELSARRRGATLPGSRCYSQHRPSSEVVLWLLRVTERRVQGGLVESSDLARYLSDNAEAVVDFRRRVLEPAVKECGLAIVRDRLGPHSLVPLAVKDSLWSLFESCNSQWPPSGEAMRKWRQFVAITHREGAAFDSQELHSWFVEKGWKPEQASALIDRLDSDAAMFAQAEELRQPA